MTPTELRSVADAITRVLEPYAVRLANPELRPEGAELVQMLRVAYL
ncbi:hypothetical protein ABIA35_009199 [Catenulispora sp. MAP12-49]